MALRPCSKHGQLYPGPALHLYPTLVTHDGSFSNHLRLCRVCFGEIVSNWAGNEMNASDGMFDDAGQRPNCPVCYEPVDPADAYQFFATSYRDSDTREDWWAPVHAGCCGRLSVDFALSRRP